MNEQRQPSYGNVRSAKQLGEVVRAHRKQQGVSLATLSGIGNLGHRFLSEFERGKETAELGKALKALQMLGLEVTVLPRHLARSLLRQVAEPAAQGQGADPRHE